MKHFHAFLLAATLIFCTACSTAQDSPTDISLGGGSDDTEIVTGNAVPDEITKPVMPQQEEIDEAEMAQQAYALIDNAESVCKIGMETIAAAWHFGIWDASECETDVVMERLAAQIGFDASYIEENGGHTADELVNGNNDFPNWEFCVITAQNCLSAAGAYTSADETLDAARDLIREIPDDYANYQNLKDYYTKVAAYAAYFKNISGSYNDLTQAITAYENDIQKAKEPLLFDFG